MTTATAFPRTPLHTVSPDNPGHGVEYGRFLDCIHCGLCLASCPTYEILGTEMDSPRGRIYLMRAVTDGRIPVDAAVQTHLDSCLDCRACETACPSGVRYHEILEPFRAGLAKTHPPRPLPWPQRLAMRFLFPFRSRSRLALAPVRLLQRSGIDGLLRRTGLMKLLPRSVRAMHDTLPVLERRYPALPEFLPAQGPRRARVVLLLGCVADAVYPDTNYATARVLQKNGCDVLIPRSQQCCGALDLHALNEARARDFARANIAACGFGGDPSAEPDAVISNAAGCGAMLKEYGHHFRGEEFSAAAARFAGKVRDVSEFLMSLGPTPPTHPVPLTATYHDACHLRHGQGISVEPRKLLALVPGLKLIPLPESELCCGAAGSYNLTQPEMAGQLGDRKAAHILATGADAVIAGNVGCLLQMAKHIRDIRPGFRVLHPMDVLWRAYSGDEP
jgi:glycolate oxidase iron-sulfur subunit